MEFLENHRLLNQSQELLPVEEIFRDKTTIIFFFSASFCNSPLCLKILELLKKLHEESYERAAGFEIVYISSDTDYDSFWEYFQSHGNWYAVPFENQMLALELRIKCEVSSLPNLTVYKTTGENISRNAEIGLLEKGINVLVTWSEY